jgi:prolyl-tRNA editing enzyme YbaK/EbsC (Cys-tRNA(Pro) deacylase)
MVVENPTQTGPHAGLLDWLASKHVEYEIREHPETYTAEATARAEHLDPRKFAKVVGVSTSDGRHVLVVVDAPDHVDLGKARRVLAASDVRLMTEAEFTALVPGCEPGTVPPIPALFGMPTYVDFALRETLMVAFHAGSHRYSVHVDRVAWERTSGIAWADLAEDDGAPAWAR